MILGAVVMLGLQPGPLLLMTILALFYPLIIKGFKKAK